MDTRNKPIHFETLVVCDPTGINHFGSVLFQDLSIFNKKTKYAIFSTPFSTLNC